MMKRREYAKPTCSVVYVGSDLMENTVPMGNSRDTTDSGDGDGGGLSKKDFLGTDENDDMFKIAWGDD